MRPLKTLVLILVMNLFSSTNLVAGQVCVQNDSSAACKLSADGPYILYNSDGSARFIMVTPVGNVKDETYPSLPENFGFDVISHDEKHKFHVTLRSVIERPQWQFPQPNKLFVSSDPHGDLDSFISLLQNNGVIDENYKWNFGTNRLVVIGDVFDRGDDVLQIFWLLYQLEKEADDAGGQVDFLLGNHEPMVLMNDLRYTNEKYTILADTLHVKYNELMGPDSELGRWLCTRNTMEIVGRYLFVHAGLSAPLLEKDLPIPVINEQMSLGLYKKRAERKEASPLIYFLHGSYGPVWYRGMVKEEEKYHPLSKDSLDLILQKYHADCVIVGHTVFEDISVFYEGKVIAVNVNNSKNREQGKGRGIMIENDSVFVVGDEGVLRRLQLPGQLWKLTFLTSFE